jgi:hypothetical protein
MRPPNNGSTATRHNGTRATRTCRLLRSRDPYRDVRDATAARCSLPALGGARSAATLRRDPVRCPGTPTLRRTRARTAARCHRRTISEPGPAARRRRHTHSAAAAVEPADDRLVGHTRRPGRGPSPPISRKIVRWSAPCHRPGHRAATAPVIQLADPEQAGHGGDGDASGGHLRHHLAAAISGVPITSDASNDSRCDRRATSACGSADPGPGQAAASRRAAPLPDQRPAWQ